MRELSSESNIWSSGNWHSLVAEFGELVAQAYREGALSFWREYHPILPSEGAAPNTTPIQVIFGLTGLAIEAREEPERFSQLSSQEAEVAARYGLLELNGFPSWFLSLSSGYSEPVLKVVLREIEYELDAERTESFRYYVLQKARWIGDWMHELLAPPLLARLERSKEDLEGLQLALSILHGSSISDEALAGLARKKAEEEGSQTIAPTWYAVWIGTDPAVAIPALAARISPGLRDDVQDARDALLAFIRETPGKEAFLALGEIAREHPAERLRPWSAYYAEQKATADARTPPWEPAQVVEFHEKQERTPSNHRDLWNLAVDCLCDLKYDLEDGDSSIAEILIPANQETAIRKYIGNWCRERAAGRYVIPQEEQLADDKRPDIRFQSSRFDGPVPVELKLADKWSGSQLFERFENQLCGDYLRDIRSSCGIYLLVNHGTKQSWEMEDGKLLPFIDLVNALQQHWTTVAARYPNAEDIRVIGIDLTKRGGGAAKKLAK